MKKSLVLVPLLALMLSGCNSGGKKKGGGGGTILEPNVDAIDFGPEVVNGYRRLTKAPKNGKEYLFGFNHYDDTDPDNVVQTMRFINGHHHTDQNGEYPFYLSTTTDVSLASKVVCEYSDKTHFAIKIVGGGEFHTYDNTYLEIHEDVNNKGKKLASIGHFAEPMDTFYWADVIEIEPGLNIRLQTAVTPYISTVEGHDIGAFGCTGRDFQTVSAQDQFTYSTAFICHFYEAV